MPPRSFRSKVNSFSTGIVEEVDSLRTEIENLRTQQEQAFADSRAQQEQAFADSRAQQEQAFADSRAQQDQAFADSRAQQDQAFANFQGQMRQEFADLRAQQDQAFADSRAQQDQAFANFQGQIQQDIANSRAQQDQALANFQGQIQQDIANSRAQQDQALANFQGQMRQEFADFRNQLEEVITQRLGLPQVQPPIDPQQALRPNPQQDPQAPIQVQAQNSFVTENRVRKMINSAIAINDREIKDHYPSVSHEWVSTHLQGFRFAQIRLFFESLISHLIQDGTQISVSARNDRRSRRSYYRYLDINWEIIQPHLAPGMENYQQQYTNAANSLIDPSD